MRYRDKVILKKVDKDNYDIKGNPTYKEIKEIKCNFQPSHKIVKKSNDGTNYLFIETKLEIETESILELGDLIVIDNNHDNPYTIVDFEIYRPLNRRLKPTYVGWCE